MPFFAEAMKGLADDLRASADERAADVRCVRAAAERVLTAARSFMTQTNREHQERARHLQHTLHEACSQRLEQVHNLCRDMQKRHRDTADALQRRLAASRRSRKEHVADLLEVFRAARADLARDLRQGASFWRGLHAQRRTAAQ